MGTCTSSWALATWEARLFGGDAKESRVSLPWQSLATMMHVAAMEAKGVVTCTRGYYLRASHWAALSLADKYRARDPECDLHTRRLDGTGAAMTPVLAVPKLVHMARPFLDAATHLGGPVVSVGSGLAGLEAEVCLELLMVKGVVPEVWCLDPCPRAWSSRISEQCAATVPLVRPRVGTLRDLERNHPDDLKYLCGAATTLLLVWCYPDVQGNYDVEAIRMLKPARIVTLCERVGVAGSTSFLHALDGYDSDGEWPRFPRRPYSEKAFGKGLVYRVVDDFDVDRVRLWPGASKVYPSIIVLDRI